MTVYVDDMRAEFRRMIMCHMIADASDELAGMAVVIGVQLRWIQNEGTAREHFDISLGMRDKAMRNGAVEITWRQCSAMVVRRQITGQLGSPDDAEAWLRQHMQDRKNKAEEAKVHVKKRRRTA